MIESPALLAHLRHVAAAVTPTQGDSRAPDAWLAEGLAPAQLHEVFAAAADDAAAGAAFALATALAAGTLPILWLRTDAAQNDGGRLHAAGLRDLGLDPDTLVLGIVRDEAALLRAAADAARCAGLGMVLVEAWGRAPGIDLTATRRLMLAAEASGVTAVLLRIGATPVPSAAATRWSIAAAPSVALEADAPGHPAFDIELLRRRGGPSGQRWRVEWNRDARLFAPLPIGDARAGDPAPLSGAGLSLVADRAAARHPPAPVRRPR